MSEAFLRHQTVQLVRNLIAIGLILHGSSVAVAAIGSATAPVSRQDQDPEVGTLPRPAWWGGPVQKLEDALQGAGDWCRAQAGLSRIGRGQSWCLQNGTWGIGAAVAKNPESAAERRELVDSLRLKANYQALCGLASVTWSSADVGALALEGAKYRQGGGSVSADLAASPRTKTYTEGEAIFVISLIDRSSVQSWTVPSLEEIGLSSLVALGILQQPETDAFPLRGLIERALEQDTSSTTIRAAAERCVKEGDEGAAKLVASSASAATLGLDVGDRALSIQSRLEALAGKDPGVAARLAEQVVLEERLDLLAQTIRQQDLAQIPLSLLINGSPSIFYVLTEPPTSDLSKRELYESLVADGGAVRSAKLAVLADGSIGASQQPQALVTGGRIRQPEGPVRWLLVEPSAELDDKLRFDGPRLRVAATGRPDQGKIVSQAALTRATQLGLWAGLSNGAVLRACESKEVRDLATWVVARGEDAYEVDFKQGVDDTLRSASQRDPYLARVEARGEVAGATRSALDRAIRAAGGVTEEPKSGATEVVFELTVSRQKEESGEDQGSNLVGKKPWVRVPVVVELVMSGPTRTALRKEGKTRKVFGGHDVTPFVDAAASDLLESCLRGFEAALVQVLDSPGELIVVGAQRDDLDLIIRAARNFGNVVYIAPDEDDETTVQARLSWPGGVSGLRRTLGALVQLPGWEQCRSVQIKRVVRSDER